MASGVRPDQVQTLAEKHGTDAAALAAAVNEEFARRGEERKRRREERLARPSPGADRYRAIRDGTYTPSRRPRSSGDDRQYVGGALRHWRTVHGLSQRQAQQRIGYASSAQTWSMWEANVSCPPYRTLLKIIAATGFGHIADDAARRSANLELDHLATDTRERLRLQRAERARVRDLATSTAIAGEP